MFCSVDNSFLTLGILLLGTICKDALDEQDKGLF